MDRARDRFLYALEASDPAGLKLGLEAALAQAEKEVDADTTARSLLEMAARFVSAEPSKSLEMLMRAAGIFETLDYPLEIGACRLVAYQCQDLLQRSEEPLEDLYATMDLLERGVNIAQPTTTPRERSLGYITAGDACLRIAERVESLEEADRWTERAIGYFELGSNPIRKPHALKRRARIALQRGQLELGIHYATSGLEILPAMPDTSRNCTRSIEEAGLHTARGELLEALGKKREAQADFEKALLIWRIPSNTLTLPSGVAASMANDLRERLKRLTL